jgi:hypothetical protein
MSSKPPLVYTLHAETVVRERLLDKSWIERTVREPQFVTGDAKDPTAKRYFGSVLERGGRILRVVCVETPHEIRILSAFFDRGAGRRK